MSQTWTDDIYNTDHEADTDLTNMEANFASLKSNFSGSSQPSNPVAGQSWFDTTKKIPKVRNNANGAWRGIMAGSASFKIWVYLAAAEDGWAIDSAIADKVLAVKSASGTYATAGATAGSWTISGFGHVHSVTGTNVNQANDPTPRYEVPYQDGADPPNTFYPYMDYVGVKSGQVTMSGINWGISGEASITLYKLYKYHIDFNTNSGGGSSDGTWRPAAAVGVIMYPDV